MANSDQIFNLHNVMFAQVMSLLQQCSSIIASWNLHTCTEFVIIAAPKGVVLKSQLLILPPLNRQVKKCHLDTQKK